MTYVLVALSATEAARAKRPVWKANKARRDGTLLANQGRCGPGKGTKKPEQTALRAYSDSNRLLHDGVC